MSADGRAPPTEIRTAKVADIEAMHRVRMSVRENRLRDPAGVKPADYLPMINEHGRGWVALVDGRVVGLAIGGRRSASVWALFVDPDYEGRGIGRRLHDLMLDWLFAQGLERVWLSTEPGTRAERFYRAARWKYMGPAPHGEARFEMSRARWHRRRYTVVPATIPASPLSRTVG